MGCGQQQARGYQLPGIEADGSRAGAWIRPLPGADRIIRVTGFASIAFAANGVAQTLVWQTPGVVIAMMGHATGPVATAGTSGGLASLAVKLTIGDGNEDVISNGASSDFATLMALHGPGHLPFPLMRKVKQSEIWTIQFTNRSTDTAYVPELSFWFRRKGRGVGQNPAREE